jgi:hypothetical protein
VGSKNSRRQINPSLKCPSQKTAKINSRQNKTKNK